MSDGHHTEPIHGAHQGDKTMPSDEPEKLASEESRRVVKICKSCMVSKSDGGAFCSHCGEELVQIRSVANSCIGAVVGGKYRIVDSLGSGGMGDVYLAINEPLDQRVAVKFLNEKFTCDEQIVLRFLNEAKSYCRINHPNAVTLLEYGQHDDGSLYLITEYVDGEGLADLVKREGPLDGETTIALGLQLCEALSAAHREGIIHRDLKPDNIMVIPGGRDNYALKVLDFGIAKIADEDGQGPRTETGSVFGTPEFMSPEQARGESVDQRADIYALGVILYYLSTGRFPFRGDTKLSILNQQINDAPTAPSRLNRGVHPQLEKVILACMSKAPEGRPPSADDVAEALEAIDLGTTREVSETTATILDLPSARVGDAERVDVGEVELSDESVIEPLGASTFDEGDGGALDLKLHAQDEGELKVPYHGDLAFAPTDPSGSWSIGDKSESWSIGNEESPSPAPIVRRRVNKKRRWPVALGAGVAGLAVVGLVTLWSPGDEATTELDSEQAAMTAVEQVWSAYQGASIGAARHYVDEGKFQEANRLLAVVDRDNLGEGELESYEALVRQASRVQNLDMRLRAAIEAQRCDRAEALMASLSEEWAGAVEARGDALETCGEAQRDASSEEEPQALVEPAEEPQPPSEMEDDVAEAPPEPDTVPAPAPGAVASADENPSESEDVEEADEETPELAEAQEKAHEEGEEVAELEEAEPTEVVEVEEEPESQDFTEDEELAQDEEPESQDSTEDEELAQDEESSEEESPEQDEPMQKAEREDADTEERVLPPSEI